MTLILSCSRWLLALLMVFTLEVPFGRLQMITRCLLSTFHFCLSSLVYHVAFFDSVPLCTYIHVACILCIGDSSQFVCLWITVDNNS
ncbi:hypothetical protein BCR43DRAFT_351506 [Syncephalastrum racemosum]|uniref:Uncharacterized protein n=1 Tax=Syncephalastrum racemosum TaxID=13706 RepID=A0A1X2H666_SYNRA|nr:hypothetical protein BCR43DRAFT_351506 [Syncephalastrum racemosum]